MLAKKIILGFGLAIVLPMLVYYGACIFSPQPKRKDYRVESYWERHKRASEEEKIRLEKEKTQLEKRYEDDRSRWARYFFFIAVPIGVVALIIGSLIKVAAVGGGLMLGGIFASTEGCFWYWADLPDWAKFLALVVITIILLWIGYQKLGGKKTEVRT